MTRILVIEDEEPLRENLRALLEAEDFDFLAAPDGLIGVQLARYHLPDLILCDIMMPGLDGYGVVQALRQDPITAAIPLVFLTAKADKADLRRGMELGADDYLTKPFTRAELLQAIATRLEKQAGVDKKFRKQLENLRDSMTLAVPHELRTPLVGILSGASLLKDNLDTLARKDIQTLAEIMYTSAERLHRCILNYLLYAELEIAAAAPSAIRTRPEAGVAVSAPVAAVAAQKAGQFTRDADLSLAITEATVLIPEVHLRKIVDELLDNAFKFSEAGTKVMVTGALVDRRYTLSFMDHGRGMTGAQIAGIGAYMQFERKLHEQQGSGMGLVLARRLAELHGGALSIESIPGRQTCVRVTLRGQEVRDDQ